MLHYKWIELTKLNEKMYSQVIQSNMEKNNMVKTIAYLQKIIVNLEPILKQSHYEDAELNSELENMKKSLKMLNFDSAKRDEILAKERSDKEHFGLGYTEKTTGGKIIFVNWRTSRFMNIDEVKTKPHVATLARTHVVIP